MPGDAGGRSRCAAHCVDLLPCDWPLGTSQLTPVRIPSTSATDRAGFRQIPTKIKRECRTQPGLDPQGAGRIPREKGEDRVGGHPTHTCLEAAAEATANAKSRGVPPLTRFGERQWSRHVHWRHHGSLR